MPPLHHVVIHRPGPHWKPGVPAFEQPGLQAHVDHFRPLIDSGALVIGGPFMDDASGGMMICDPGMSREDVERFAAEDPTVRSGLLVCEIRPWLAALSK